MNGKTDCGLNGKSIVEVLRFVMCLNFESRVKQFYPCESVDRQITIIHLILTQQLHCEYSLTQPEACPECDLKYLQFLGYP